MVVGIQPVRHARVVGVGDAGGLLENHGDGVVGPDVLEGVAVHGPHALAVYQDVGDLVALGGGDG